VDPVENPLPVMVTATPEVLPAVAVDTERLVMFGTGLTVKLYPSDVVLSPFTTVTDAVSGLAIIPEVTGPVSCVPLTTVVELNCVPLNLILAPETNPVPFTVSVNPLPLAVAEDGLRLVMVAVGTASIGKELGSDVVPSLFSTATIADPTLAIIGWLTSIVICVGLTTVVAPGKPFQRITAAGLNPEPLTVNSNALPPAVA
jgi:hypothetical protein